MQWVLLRRTMQSSLYMQKCTDVKLIRPDASESDAKPNHGEWPLEGLQVWG